MLQIGTLALKLVINTAKTQAMNCMPTRGHVVKNAKACPIILDMPVS